MTKTKSAETDADKERLHNNAVARWRRERTASDADEEKSAPITAPVFLQIPLDSIAPSPTNPRKFFDQAKLQELADSIEAHGLIEPILVRPRPGRDEFDDGPEYQLIAGERRWRACHLVEDMVYIEAKVRDLDDRAVLEIQLIENLQREDVSPIEEADGYMAMLDLKNPDGTSVYTVDSLAAKIGKKGKSKSYVYGRLKLRNLPQPALEAIAKGELPATIGELIGRLPSAELRQKFWDSNFYDYGKDWFRAPSFRDIKQKIESGYIVELKGAPFSQTDKKLVPAAGDCKNCPKRTGNNRAEYPDGRADLCTDVNCFDLKTKLFQERQLMAAAGEGVEVLNAQEAKQWFPWGSLTYAKQKEFVDLADGCEEAPEPEGEDADYPTYAELLGEIKPDVVGYDDRGMMHRLVKKERAAEILRSKHGIEIEADDDRSSTPAYFRESQQEKEERQILKQAREMAVEQIAAKVAEHYDAEFTHRRAIDATFPLDNLLRIVAGALLYYFDSSAGFYDTIKRRNPNDPTLKDLDEFEMSENEAAAKLLEGADAAEIIGTLAEVCVRAELHGWSRLWSSEDRRTPICDFIDLKIENFEQVALEALKPKPEPNVKPKKEAVAQA
jgi:ParB/RepB/Spo0J family partition protein